MQTPTETRYVFDVETEDGRAFPLGVYVRDDEDVVVYSAPDGSIGHAPESCVETRTVYDLAATTFLASYRAADVGYVPGSYGSSILSTAPSGFSGDGWGIYDRQTGEILVARAFRVEALAEQTKIERERETDLPPVCPYCTKRLTSNEFDDEPGSTPGYFSSHSRCTNPTPEGRYEVYSKIGDGNVEGGPGRRYRTEKRATEKADDLASWNRPRCVFYVFDRETGKFLAEFAGKLVDRSAV